MLIIDRGIEEKVCIGELVLEVVDIGSDYAYIEIEGMRNYELRKGVATDILGTSITLLKVMHTENYNSKEMEDSIRLGFLSDETVLRSELKDRGNK